MRSAHHWRGALLLISAIFLRSVGSSISVDAGFSAIVHDKKRSARASSWEDAVTNGQSWSSLATYMSSMRMMLLAGQSRKSLLNLASSILGFISEGSGRSNGVLLPPLRGIHDIYVGVEFACDRCG